MKKKKEKEKEKLFAPFPVVDCFVYHNEFCGHVWLKVVNKSTHRYTEAEPRPPQAALLLPCLLGGDHCGGATGVDKLDQSVGGWRADPAGTA